MREPLFWFGACFIFVALWAKANKANGWLRFALSSKNEVNGNVIQKDFGKTLDWDFLWTMLMMMGFVFGIFSIIIALFAPPQ